MHRSTPEVGLQRRCWNKPGLLIPNFQPLPLFRQMALNPRPFCRLNVVHAISWLFNNAEYVAALRYDHFNEGPAAGRRGER